MIYLFSLITVVALAGLVSLFTRQAVRLSRGEVSVAQTSTVGLVIEPVINYLAFQFVILCRESGQRLMVLALSLGREVAMIGRRELGRLEHRFAHLINLVKGRGVPSNRGSVSFFLREIDEYKKAMGANGETNNRPA